MSTIHEIKHAVAKLSPEELSRFRAWFVEFDALAWDRQIEADVAAGRLDWLAEEALGSVRNARAAGSETSSQLSSESQVQ